MALIKQKIYVNEPGPYNSFDEWWGVFECDGMVLEDTEWGKHKVGAKLGGYEVLKSFRYQFDGGQWNYVAWVKHSNGKQGTVWKGKDETV